MDRNPPHTRTSPIKVTFAKPLPSSRAGNRLSTPRLAVAPVRAAPVVRPTIPIAPVRSAENLGTPTRISTLQVAPRPAPPTENARPTTGFSKSSGQPTPEASPIPLQRPAIGGFSKGGAHEAHEATPSAPAAAPKRASFGGFRKGDTSAIPDAVEVITPPPFKFDPTKLSGQQLDIIHCDAPFVVGQAFAGTGKSTTGIGYAHMMLDTQPNARILSICFNRANALELNGKYPRANTVVQTTHSLATQVLSEKQRQRLRQANTWGPVLIRHELAKFGYTNAGYRLAATINSVLNSFFVDTSDKIDPDVHGRQAMATLNADDRTIETACHLAEKLWLAMGTDNVVPGMKTSINDIPIPHNAYLKRFVMSRPQLPFHTIIFDEAQDANPIMLKLLHDQYEQGAKIILLGDAHQSIYEFNGAVNAMSVDNLPDDGRVQVLPLTQSWRFGSNIAQIANLLLSELKGEPHRVEGMAENATFKNGDPITYISRTNAEVLSYAVSNIDKGLHWVGGIDGYRIHLLGDAYHLYSGNTHLIKDKQFKRFFPNWNEFERAAEVDSESRILRNLVEEYTGELPRIQEELSRNDVRDPDMADLRISTGHKSKGLEFDHVVMANDFKETLESAEGWLAHKHDNTYPEQEINLCYVLATRAKKSFTPSASMQEWMQDLPKHRSARVRSWGQDEVLDPQWETLPSQSVEQDPFSVIAPPPVSRYR